jgi:hypothetical protein
LNIPSTRCASKRKRWVSLIHAGIQTMTVTTPKQGQSTPFAGTPSIIDAAHLPHVLGAYNALNLASVYLQKGNLAAARRKAVLALASLNELRGAQA